MSQTIFQRISSIIVNTLGVFPQDVTLGASFWNDLGADSFDAVELAMAIEDEFNLELTPEEDEELMRRETTVGDVVRFVETRGAQ